MKRCAYSLSSNNYETLPVDIERNNRIEDRQGNRNPYIDHPELVARAWEHDGGSAVNSEIARNIEALRAEITDLENTLAKLKAELARLETSLND